MRGFLDKLHIRFTAFIVENAIYLILRATGESLIETTTPRKMMNGRKVNILAIGNFFLAPLRSIGIPIPEYGWAGYHLYNSSFGIIPIISGEYYGPYEHYLRTENGHVTDEAYKFKDETLV